MASSYVLPIISWLPYGYDCVFVMPPAAVASCLVGGTGALDRRWQVSFGGTLIAEGHDELVFADGELVAGPKDNLRWRAADAERFADSNGGIFEFALTAVDDAPVFLRTTLPGQYNVYLGQDRKSFFGCHTWKFASPPVIYQIARFGRYIDAYPVIHIDRERDLCDSVVLINPYSKSVIAQVMTFDERQLRRIVVRPMSACRVDLRQLLRDDESEWFGDIQITANNRLVTYVVKHAYSDPDMINTVEHLDPFRGEETHRPWAQVLRYRFGKWRARQGWS